MEQEAENHHHDSAKAAIQQVTKEHPISNEHLRQKWRKREPQIGKPADVKEGPSLHRQIEEPPSARPDIPAPQDQQSSQYCLPERWYGGETVEHVMGGYSGIHHPATISSSIGSSISSTINSSSIST